MTDVERAALTMYRIHFWPERKRDDEWVATRFGNEPREMRAAFCRLAAWHLRALRKERKAQPFKDQFRDEAPPRKRR